MAYYSISNVSNTSFLTSGDALVYGGKKGFTTESGTVPVLCNNFSSNVTSIVLTIPDLHLLVDDNLGLNLLEIPSYLGEGTFYITAPISQYAPSSYKEGAVGHTFYDSFSSLEVQSYNIAANTITVGTKSTVNPIDNYFTALPFYVYINQPITTSSFANNSMFISGTSKKIVKKYNVSAATDTYTAVLPLASRYKEQVSVYLDSIGQEDFTWESNATATSLGVDISTEATELRVELNHYTTPAIEANDFIAFSSSSNTYKISNTSYQSIDGSFDQSLTDSYLYKVILDKSITSNVGSTKVINVSRDLEGRVGNLTSNSFTVDYRDDYPFTHTLANNGIYYVYQKDKVRKIQQKPDELGIVKNIPTGTYLVEASTINRFNRSSEIVPQILNIEPIRLSKVQDITITEDIFIDTTGGASITATVSFPPIVGADVTSYDIVYRVVSDSASIDSTPTTMTIDNDESVSEIKVLINNLKRGRSAGTNTLVVTITPKNGSYGAFPSTATKSLIGKTDLPSGLTNLNVVQQNEDLYFAWQFQQTVDGFILDLDTKEVEIREYPGNINTSSQSEVQAIWPISLIIERIPFPNTFFSIPTSKFGTYTYLLRVRDTSDNESEFIAASTVVVSRPTEVRVFKAYSEHSPSTNFILQDGQEFPNSNVYAENAFPSVSMGINGGLVLSDSTHVDNANGSSQNFTVDNGFITSDASLAVYTTQIRDVGSVIKGTIRVSPKITISSTNTTFTTQYEQIVEGVSDVQDNSSNVLVDVAFGGIGHLLGFDNSSAAIVSYNSYHKTLTSGGRLGNIYAIRNTGQFDGDEANTNAYCLIAGVINANAIALGESYYANNNPTGTNAFSNVTIAGNSYQLINLYQYGDPESSVTFLGEERSIVQNVFIRYSSSNVFYEAAANGVSGLPGHGNTNVFAFVGAATNAEASYKKYIVGDLDFRYFQVKVEILNKEPTGTAVSLEELSYEVDIVEKTINKNVEVNSVDGVVVDYSYANLVQTPFVVSSLLNSTDAYSVIVSEVSNNNCNVKVLNNVGTAVTTENVTVVIRGV